MSVLRRPGSANWYVQFQLNGRTFLRSTKTTDKRSAEKLEVLWRAEAHSESFLGQRSRIKLGVALADYCESKKAAPSHRNCLVHLRILLRELDANSWLDTLSSADLERFKRTRSTAGISPQTIKHSFGVLIGAVKLAKRVGHQVPVLDVPTVKLPRHKLRYLSEAEELRLISELDPTRDCRHFAKLERRHPLTVQQMQDTFDLVVILLDTGV